MTHEQVIQGCLGSKTELQLPTYDATLHPGEECAICYDVFAEKEKVVICEECNKPFHVKCITVWKQHCKKERVPVTCPMCRHQLIL
jgi:uncharacterized protein YbaR (Trm112 family)